MAQRRGRKAGPRPGGARPPRRARTPAAEQVGRPFAGLAAECDLVALREFVSSATAMLSLTEPGRPVLLATVLPMASAALIREGSDGGEGGDSDEVGMVGLQVQQVPSVDLSSDVGATVAWSRTAAAGTSLDVVTAAMDGPRLQDLLVADAHLDITVHQDFGWWIPGTEPPVGEVAASLERANAAVMPTDLVRADGVRSAWWVDTGDKAHLRWVRPEDEDDLMLALARVHAAGALTLGEGSRFAGSFRAHGLLVPVFDLDRDRHAQEWAAATASLGAALDEALTVDGPLTPPQRRSRDGLRARQVTLRA